MCLVNCEQCEPGVGRLVDNGIVKGVLERFSDNALVKLQGPIEQRNDLAVAIERSSGTSDGLSSRHSVLLVGCSSSGICLHDIELLACCQCCSLMILRKLK